MSAGLSPLASEFSPKTDRSRRAFRWIPESSLSSHSCQARFRSSKSMRVFPFGKVGPFSLKLVLDPVDPSAYIAHRNTENVSDGVVRIPVQIEQHESLVQFAELVDESVQQPELIFQFGSFRRRHGNFQHGLVCRLGRSRSARFCPVKRN